MGVATLIRSHIDAIEEEEERPNAMGDSDKPTNFGNVQFGARQKPCLFAELEEQTSSDPLYSNLRKSSQCFFIMEDLNYMTISLPFSCLRIKYVSFNNLNFDTMNRPFFYS
jgi:hypothetical protein